LVFFSFFFLNHNDQKKKVRRAIAGLLDKYPNDPQASLDTRRQNLNGRKLILSSVVLFFSEGMFLFFVFVLLFICLFFSAARSSRKVVVAPHQEEKPPNYLTLPSALVTQTAGISLKPMAYVFFPLFFVF